MKEKLERLKQDGKKVVMHTYTASEKGENITSNAYDIISVDDEKVELSNSTKSFPVDDFGKWQADDLNHDSFTYRYHIFLTEDDAVKDYMPEAEELVTKLVINEIEKIQKIVRNEIETIHKIIDAPKQKDGTDAPDESLHAFRAAVLAEMDRLNADEHSKNLLNDRVIATAIRNGSKPEDLAWALTQ